MYRVLTVDDDVLVRRVIERILKEADYEVFQAASGDEAIRLAKTTRFDVALVDYMLPRTDGLEVMQHLRRLQPQCMRVLVTARLDLPLVIEAVNRGEVARVVSKPFEASELVRVVSETLRVRRDWKEHILAQVKVAEESERAVFDEVMAGDYLRLALQPIVSGTTQQPLAFECLLRSTHPVLNGPLPVLRAAEAAGALGELGGRVMQMAADWLERLPPGPMVFVNLHTAELEDVQALVRRLKPLIPHASRVVFEITERQDLRTVDGWEEAVELLRQVGFSIAVDDLGAGASTLALLADLKPRFIKLDMGLVRGVDTEPHKERLIELLCTFAEATGARIVAEGVETAGEGRVLSACGAHLLQGYFYGRPGFEPERVLEAA